MTQSPQLSRAFGFRSTSRPPSGSVHWPLRVPASKTSTLDLSHAHPRQRSLILFSLGLMSARAIALLFVPVSCLIKL